MNMQDHLSKLSALMDKASAAIMGVYNANVTVVDAKADDSPITQADVASHQILVSGLESLFPDIPVISEEGDPHKKVEDLKQKRFWLVDPIDGTKEFINRIGEFTILLGLIEDGVPVFGMIAVPAHGDVYYGGPGMGSFKKHGNDEPVAIHVAQHQTGIVMGSRSHAEAATDEYIAQYYPGTTVESVGSALKLLYIAEGKADAMPRLNHTMKLWDLAPGHAILAGAGGTVTRPDGSAIDYRNPTFLVGDFVADSQPLTSGVSESAQA